MLSSPLVPVIGDGSFPLQPVHIETVAEAVIRAVQDPRHAEFDLGGPDVLTYLELLERIARVLGRRLHTIRLPVSLIRRWVPMLEKSPRFPLTSDQLTMLLEGNACAPGRAEATHEALGLEPRPVTDEDLLASLQA
ncbi:MAG: hypothetical protein IRZ33_06630 [Alicyclobacillaceae bacterium]|nr:hypothetical protein [Alicyclobacillaceae bacterium]